MVQIVSNKAFGYPILVDTMNAVKMLLRKLGYVVTPKMQSLFYTSESKVVAKVHAYTRAVV